MARDWIIALNKLPALATISLDEADAIDKLKADYDKMTDYQKSFIAEEKVKDLDAYVKRLEEVREAAGIGKDDETEGPDGTEPGDKEEGTGDTEKPEEPDKSEA